MKKKMLITASTFPRWSGDTEPRFILDYAKAMKEYYDITVLVPSAPGAENREQLEGVDVVRFHYFPIHQWETLCYPGAIVPRIKQKKIRGLLVPFLLFAMMRNVKKYSADMDIVHAHWLIPQGIVQTCVDGTPYILTGHGGDVTSLNVWPIKQMKIKAIKRARYITTVSSALHENVQGLYRNDKSSIVPMGCNTREFSPDRRVKDYFGQGNKKTVLFVGRLAEKKGVTYLIEAMKRVDDAVLCVVGKGELEQQLKEQAKELGDKVMFLGPKTHDELPEIYASADVFVAPSITARDGDTEGFGLVIIEAMASGLPVVSSNCGGIPDIITNNVNGILCEEKNIDEIANAINSLICNDNLRERIVAYGKQTAKQNDYQEVARRYKEIIDSVI